MYLQLSKQKKAEIIEEIRTFFIKERNEELGSLEAESLLEFFKKQLGPHYFNEGLKEAKQVASEKLLQLEEELELLERPVK